MKTGEPFSISFLFLIFMIIIGMILGGCLEDIPPSDSSTEHEQPTNSDDDSDDKDFPKPKIDGWEHVYYLGNGDSLGARPCENEAEVVHSINCPERSGCAKHDPGLNDCD